MRRILIAVCLLGAFVACKKGVPVSMIAGSAIAGALPFNVYNNKEWRPDPDARYVKLHTYVDAPVRITAVHLETCNPLKGATTMYINFDEKVVRLDTKQNPIKHTFKAPVVMRSTTFNFRKNKNVCVKSVRFFNEKNEEVKFRTPRLVQADVASTSQLKPKDSYHVMNLFDSRYENAFSSDGFPKGGFSINFNFKSKQTIKQLKIWNGYQLSLRLCLNNARVKTLVVKGDGGYEEKLAVKDVMGAQVLNLKKPFRGKKLELYVPEVYKGWYYKDVVISELRFSDGENWFIPDPLPQIKSTITKYKAAFEKAGVGDLLNGSAKGTVVREEPQYEDGVNSKPSADSGSFTLRLRSDGTFYFGGRASTTDHNQGVEKDQEFSSLGNYEIKSVSSSEIKIRIFGMLHIHTEKLQIDDMDCNGCGSDCNLNTGDSKKKNRIFHEFFTIKKTKTGYFLRDTTKNRKFAFKALSMELED